MSIGRIGRNVGVLLLLLLVSPLVPPLAAWNPLKHSKSSKHSKKANQPSSDANQEPDDRSDFTKIEFKIIANEWQMRGKMQDFSPRIETYLQYYKPDDELGDVATSDDYFLGRLKFSKGADNQVSEASFIPDSTAEWVRLGHGMLMSHIQMNQFAVEPLVVDENNFDRKHYTFHPVRWEFLGAVRCLAIDIQPRDMRLRGAFEGRIWVEDQNFNIVRLNGIRLNPPKWAFYVHFDCWRENLRPGLWLPVYIYSQETDRGKKYRYKAETRLWGYNLAAHHIDQAWTNILIDAAQPVHDASKSTADLTPVESTRQINTEGERNVLDRLEKAGLIAPPGPVDKVLETVVNNLRVTNNLDNLPPVHCRVMETSSLESFSLMYTIVLSRGLIDVLPDEASLAMILAHELGHITLGHRLDAKYAFSDHLQVSDEDLLSSLDITRSRKDEMAADAKGLELLRNSPYKDKLTQAGLFLRAAADAAPRTPNLFGTHLGNGLTELDSKKDMRMESLAHTAPALTPRNVAQLPALPLGSRLQVDPWDGSVSFAERKADVLIDATEKMSFRVTPIVPYLREYPSEIKTDAPAKN